MPQSLLSFDYSQLGQSAGLHAPSKKKKSENNFFPFFSFLIEDVIGAVSSLAAQEQVLWSKQEEAMQILTEAGETIISEGHHLFFYSTKEKKLQNQFFKVQSDGKTLFVDFRN